MEIGKVCIAIIGMLFLYSLCFGNLLIFFGEDPQTPLLKALAVMTIITFSLILIYLFVL